MSISLHKSKSKLQFWFIDRQSTVWDFISKWSQISASCKRFFLFCTYSQMCHWNWNAHICGNCGYRPPNEELGTWRECSIEF